MPAKHRLPMHIQRELRDALSSARLERASFSMDKVEDERIKRAIKIYLDTWVASRIEHVLKWSNGASTDPN